MSRAHLDPPLPRSSVGGDAEEADQDEETYTVPLQDQRVFGAGIKRKRIFFVPARTDSEMLVSEAERKARGEAAARRYRDIVLPLASASASASGSASRSRPEALQQRCVQNKALQSGTGKDSNSTSLDDEGASESIHKTTKISVAQEPGRAPSSTEPTQPIEQAPSSKSPMETEAEAEAGAEEAPRSESKSPDLDLDLDSGICPVCNHPLSLTHHRKHTSTSSPSHSTLLAHQVSLPHTHAPSSLDRTRMGLRYLQSYGWDPDSRLGLGPNGQGMRDPVRPVEKRDSAALGAERPGNADGRGTSMKNRNKNRNKKSLLNAKEVRRQAARERETARVLSGMVFGRDEDVERLLNGG